VLADLVCGEAVTMNSGRVGTDSDGPALPPGLGEILRRASRPAAYR
jgi:hypothetical protein